MARSDLNFSNTNYLGTKYISLDYILYRKYVTSIEEKIEHYSFAQANDRKN